MNYCKCEDWKELKNNNTSVFQWDPTYGWVLNWIELTDDGGYTQVHRYGIAIKFCPICGRELETS
jgi:hypothetical protein